MGCIRMNDKDNNKPTSQLGDSNYDLFKNRISLIAESAGGASSLARMADVAESVVRKWKNGASEPTRPKLISLSVATNVSLVWLMTGEGPMRLDNQPSAAVDNEMSEFALIPGYDIQISAGSGSLTDSEQMTRKLAFRHRWLKYKGLKTKDLVLVFTKGDSMEPTISDNNTLMIDTSQLKLNDGHIYVIRFNDHLVVKRIQTTMTGFYLISDNKEYEKMEVTYNAADDLQIIGRVVWIGKDL